tara:strand:+ start:603 stop:1004 length:402 start_codon:yes stop_codon:yes gene_type:complete
VREEREGNLNWLSKNTRVFFCLFPLFFSCLFFVFVLLFLNPKHFGCVFYFLFYFEEKLLKRRSKSDPVYINTDDFWTTTRQHLGIIVISSPWYAVPRRRFGVALFLRRLFSRAKMDARRRVGLFATPFPSVPV